MFVESSIFQKPSDESLKEMTKNAEDLRSRVETFYDSYVSWQKALKTFLQEAPKTQTDALKRIGDEEARLRERYDEYQKKIREKEAELEEKAGELESVTTSCDEAKAKLKELTQIFEEVKAKNQELKATVDNLQKDVDAMARKREAVNAYAKKLVTLYEDHLGMRIEPLDSRTTRILFNHLDPDHPEQASVLLISITADNRYEIVRCEPVIGEMSRLQAKLNETNDFFGFLKEVRRAFKAVALGKK